MTSLPCWRKTKMSEWREEKLKNLFFLKYGKNLPTTKLTENGYPVFGANGQIGFYIEYTYEKPQLLITCRGATCGTLNISLPFSFITNNSIVIQDLHNETDFKFIYHLLKSLPKDSIITGSAQPQITIANLQELSILLPPTIEEQQRIVECLEERLGRLNAAREKLEKIPLILKRFRQSVLANACSGKLTEQWRDGKDLPDWVETTLIDVIIGKPKNGYSPQGVNYITPYRNLTLTATTSGKFLSDKFKYINIDIDETSHLWIKHNDILIQRSNSIEYVGTSAIYTGEDNQYVYPDLMMKITVNNKKAVPQYVNYSLSNLDTRQYYIRNATGTAGNMPKINQTTVSNTKINLPPLPEQEKIVSRVDRLFDIADSIEGRYHTTKEKLDKAEKALYAKAFRGEL